MSWEERRGRTKQEEPLCGVTRFFLCVPLVFLCVNNSSGSIEDKLSIFRPAWGFLDLFFGRGRSRGFGRELSRTVKEQVCFVWVIALRGGPENLTLAPPMLFDLD